MVIISLWSLLWHLRVLRSSSRGLSGRRTLRDDAWIDGTCSCEWSLYFKAKRSILKSKWGTSAPKLHDVTLQKESHLPRSEVKPVRTQTGRTLLSFSSLNLLSLYVSCCKWVLNNTFCIYHFGWRVLILISQLIMEACFHHWIKKQIIKKKVIATFYLTIAR